MNAAAALYLAFLATWFGGIILGWRMRGDWDRRKEIRRLNRDYEVES